MRAKRWWSSRLTCRKSLDCRTVSWSRARGKSSRNFRPLKRPKKKSCMRRSTDAGCRAVITTKAVCDVITIADIEALEGRPYNELVPARTLIDLLRATAHAHPDRPAITTVPRGGISGRSSTMSHRDLYKRVVRAANFFDGLMQAAGGG